MPQAIGSAGSFLSGLPSTIGGFFGGGGSAPPSIPSADNPGITAPVPMETSGVGVVPPSGDSSGGLMAAPASDPLANYFTGGAGPNPTPTDLAYPAASAMGPTGGVGFNPVSASELAMSGAFGKDVTDPMTGQPLPTAIGDPASSSPWGDFLKAILTPQGGAGALGGIGNLVENIMRFNTMRTLQNPAALASGAAGLYQPMSKALKRAIISPVTAAAQETGQINAPGLYSQSVATALAPYQYQMQMNALREYIDALQASGGAYPQGGVGGYGSSGADTSGGSSS